MGNTQLRIFWYRLGRMLLRLFDASVALAAVGMAAFTVGLLFARLHWMVDNAASFELVYFPASVVVLLLVIVRRKRALIAMAGVLTVYHAFLVLPYYVSMPQARAGDSTFRIMSANLQWDSGNPRRVYEVIEQENPDILALQEVTPSRLQELERLRKTYPYWAHCVGENMLGIALLSRTSLTNGDRQWVTHGVYPTLIADLELHKRKVSILLTHTVPPFSAEWAALRDKQLADIGARIFALNGTSIIVGDLNATMWTPSFGDLLRKAALSNARNGFGVLPTYSSGMKRLVPIDHVLFRGELTVTACRVGPEMGSDHRALIVDLALTSP
ncbi:MAG: endonuclease/exonuclease/phosphatase family protein [Candidatus Hydrogenedentes bacterium]|nr:endonuclease/exonuclease/phosphatase family protein [Candidatus Hydrogenedentota bacterium]